MRVLPISELTVHHKDHNHDNNPDDGSNWELLCLYCHDHEHAKYLDRDVSVVSASNHLNDKPFANLKSLLKDK
ncbi:MAG: HNH nuclease family protein [Porticoccus sp.]|nr:HNH nuclease family protein [Porticoccus sp.]